MSTISPDAIGVNVGAGYAGKRAVKAGSAITKFKIVQVYAADGKHMTAQHASQAAKSTVVGPLFIARHDIPSGKIGQVYEWMVLEGVDTSGGAVGDPVYLGTAGAWTLTVTAGKLPRRVGLVLTANATTGRILLDPSNLFGTGDQTIPPINLMAGFTKNYGGVPLTFEAQTGNAADTATVASPLVAGSVIDVWAIKTDATGGSGDTCVVKNHAGSTIATLDLNGVAAGGVVRATSINQSNKSIAADANILLTTTKATDCRALVFVVFRPSATAP